MLLVYVLAFIWQLPAALLAWGLVVLPLWACGQLRYDGVAWYRGRLPFVVFIVPNASIIAVIWRGRFLGASFPYCALVSAKRFEEIVRHEARHVMHWAVFGPLFLPVYLLMLFICGYFDNPFEVDASMYSLRHGG